MLALRPQPARLPVAYERPYVTATRQQGTGAVDMP